MLDFLLHFLARLPENMYGEIVVPNIATIVEM
jgi:hypothetical protein